MRTLSLKPTGEADTRDLDRTWFKAVGFLMQQYDPFPNVQSSPASRVFRIEDKDRKTGIRLRLNYDSSRNVTEARIIKTHPGYVLPIRLIEYLKSHYGFSESGEAKGVKAA